jgi:hypothetical protein
LISKRAAKKFLMRAAREQKRKESADSQQAAQGTKFLRAFCFFSSALVVSKRLFRSAM